MPARRGSNWLSVTAVVFAVAVLGGVATLVILRLHSVFERKTDNGDASATEKRPDGVPDLEALRRRFPYESLADRLAYEDNRNRAEELPLPAPTLKRLKEVENFEPWKGGRNSRRRALMDLHANNVEAFIKRPNNGIARMPDATPVETLELPPVTRISFEYVSGSTSGAEGDRMELAPAGHGPRPTLEILGEFHEFGRHEFLDPTWFGHVKDREHVAGFASHHFRTQPWLNVTPDRSGSPPERWALTRLELASLLKHEQPAVYVSDHLPQMDDLKKSATRPLSAFEDRALKEMRKGEDLVTEATTNRILMIGSLRATTQCLDCHRARRGDLLGAFTYELRRDPSAGK